MNKSGSNFVTLFEGKKTWEKQKKKFGKFKNETNSSAVLKLSKLQMGTASLLLSALHCTGALCAVLSATVQTGHKTIRMWPEECYEDGEGSRGQDV